MQEIVGKKKVRPLSKRVEALEAEVAELKQLMQQAGATPAGSAADRDLQAWGGLFKDDPGFDEAVKLGRAWRSRQPKC